MYMKINKLSVKTYIISAIIIVVAIVVPLSITNINNEKHCQFISSHGIKNSFFGNNKILYIKSNRLPKFIPPAHKFVLITGDEDTTMPNDFMDKANEILNNPNL
jgi:hypothetical protein